MVNYYLKSQNTNTYVIGDNVIACINNFHFYQFLTKKLIKIIYLQRTIRLSHKPISHFYF